MTSRTRRALNLTNSRSERLRIKTFGTASKTDSDCEVVKFGLETIDGELLELTALVVPLICPQLTCQSISRSGERYPHLAGLQLADSANAHDCLEVDLLIGSDYYWSLVTGGMRKGANGLSAVHTRVGWGLWPGGPLAIFG